MIDKLDLNILGAVAQVVVLGLSIVTVIAAFLTVVVTVKQSVAQKEEDQSRRGDLIKLLQADLNRLNALIVLMAVDSLTSVFSILFTSAALGVVAIILFSVGIVYTVWFVITLNSRLFKLA